MIRRDSTNHTVFINSYYMRSIEGQRKLCGRNLKFECSDCDIAFDAKLKEDGFLPDCPECGIDYRVFQIKEDE